jgi:hypothetical protein
MAQQMQMQIKNVVRKIESRKAVLIAEMMEEFMKKKKKLLLNLIMIQLQN